jgi:hypothetical protein
MKKVDFPSERTLVDNWDFTHEVDSPASAEIKIPIFWETRLIISVKKQNK